jgi:hypothetical protein
LETSERNVSQVSGTKISDEIGSSDFIGSIGRVIDSGVKRDCQIVMPIASKYCNRVILESVIVKIQKIKNLSKCEKHYNE